MNTNALQKAVSLACVMSICFTSDCLMALENPAEAKQEYLTVRQSLIPMFGRGGFSEYYVDEEFPLNRINPKAKEYIRFYLEEDNSDPMHVYGAVWLLGFIGDADDVSFIEHYVGMNLRSSKNLEHPIGHLRNLAGIVGCFTGMVMKRDIEGAELLLKKYARVSSWVIPGEEETPESLVDARDFYSRFIVAAYQYSKADYIYPLLQERSPGPKPYFHELFADSLRKMEVDKYTELMNQKAVPQKKLNEIIAKSLERYGQWIDMLMKKQTYRQWREAHEKQKAVVEATKEPAESFENIDMSETVEGRYMKAIARDATEAFEQVSRRVLDRNAKDAPIKKEVLQDIQRAGLKSYDSFQVTVGVEARVDGFSAATTRDERNTTKPPVIREKKAAAVTFRIQGTADILKKHAPEAVPNGLISATGDLMVRMKRANDAWQWGSDSGPQAGAMIDIIEDEYLVENLRAATVAYGEIAKTLINGSYDLLTIPVIDNGELIPLEKRKKDKDKMAKALEVEKRILEELMNANLDAYGDHRIEVRWEATLGHDETDAEMGVKPLTVRGYETADVTFTIRNAAEAYRKHAPERSGYDSLDGAGNLRVWMKRINGKWYWNPFGW